MDETTKLPTVPTNPAADDLRDRLAGFVRYRKEHLTGDEKGEAQLFLENLFTLTGVECPTSLLLRGRSGSAGLNAVTLAADDQRSLRRSRQRFRDC